MGSKRSNDTINQKIEQSVVDYLKNPDIGIDYELVEAYVGKTRWVINPDGYMHKTKQLMRDLQKDHRKYMQANDEKMKNAPLDDQQFLMIERQEKDIEITRNILEEGLVNFNYDQAANQKGVGEVALQFLGTEVSNFLLGAVSKDASLHSQMLLKIMRSQNSSGLTDSKKSAKS